MVVLERMCGMEFSSFIRSSNPQVCFMLSLSWVNVEWIRDGALNDWVTWMLNFKINKVSIDTLNLVWMPYHACCVVHLVNFTLRKCWIANSFHCKKRRMLFSLLYVTSRQKNLTFLLLCDKKAEKKRKIINGRKIERRERKKALQTTKWSCYVIFILWFCLCLCLL